MELIAMDSEVFKSFMEKIDEIKDKIDDFKNETGTSLSEKWADNTDFCKILHISKRTAQSMRDSKQINFSKINGKIYYRILDIEKLLMDNYQ